MDEQLDVTLPVAPEELPVEQTVAPQPQPAPVTATAPYATDAATAPVELPNLTNEVIKRGMPEPTKAELDADSARVLAAENSMSVALADPLSLIHI